MAGDAFKKVQPGQRLEVTAEAFNAFLDAARAVREHKVFGTEASQFFRQSGIVKVKNVLGMVFSTCGVQLPGSLVSRYRNRKEKSARRPSVRGQGAVATRKKDL